MARVVVMGVSGCGKSTVGALLAEAMGVPFADGDDFHPEVNLKKMADGVPLTDEDRWPWLADVAAWLGAKEKGVVACSALRRPYRDVIRLTVPDAVFVHLSAPKAALVPRVDARREEDSRFVASGMLDSQFAALELLDPDEPGVEIDVARTTPAEACEAALGWIRPDPG